MTVSWKTKAIRKFILMFAPLFSFAKSAKNIEAVRSTKKSVKENSEINVFSRGA